MNTAHCKGNVEVSDEWWFLLKEIQHKYYESKPVFITFNSFEFGSLEKLVSKQNYSKLPLKSVVLSSENLKHRVLIWELRKYMRYGSNVCKCLCFL